MSQKLASILRRIANHAIPTTYTHEIIHGVNTSKWEVGKANYGEFLKDYCSFIANGDDDYDGLEEPGLAERPKETMPFIIQLNLVFDPVHYKEPFDDDFIYTFLYHVQSSMRSNLQIEIDEDELICVVLESETYTDEKGRKRIDMRFQFPMCKVDSSIQRKVLMPAIIRRLRSENMASKFFHQPIGDWDVIIDQEITTRPVTMYGSATRAGATPMTFRSIIGPTDWESIKDHDIDSFIIKLDDPDNPLNPLNHSFVFQGFLSASVFADPANKEFWLPAILSVEYWTRITLQKVNSRSTPSSASTIYGTGGPAYDLDAFGKGTENHVDMMSKMDMCENFVRMWGPERILKKSYWTAIGEALYDADDGEGNGLRTWVDLTQKAIQSMNGIPNFLMDELGTPNVPMRCENDYYTLRPERITVKSLAWHAREDNKSAYDAWHKVWCAKSMEQAVMTQTDVSVAKAFCRIYWLDIICTHAGKKVIWYKFNKHRWMEVPGGYSIRRIMSDDFVNKFRSMRLEILNQAQSSRNQNDTKNSETICKKIGDLINNLERSGFLNGVMSMVSDRMSHDSLDELLDDNPEILGLPNGVIMATREGIEFRNGRPEDYVSKNTNVSLRRDYHMEHPHVKKVLEWMKQVFADDELFEHFMKWSASTLRGGNNDKHLSVWSGMGDNSKSMLVKLFEAVFGSYCIKMPIGLASAGGRGNANGPSPAIARSRATRLCFMEEPGANTRFDSDLFKHLTGADRFFARMLKKNGGDIRPTFKLILMCNKIPSIPRDKAMENRLRIYAFMSTWVDDPVVAEAEYRAMNGGQSHGRFFKLNTMFEDEIPAMAPAALWLWFTYYDKYIQFGIRKTPEIIKKKTQEYWEDNDTYFQFAADQVEPAIINGIQDPNSRLDLNQLYTSFKIWHKGSYNRTKIPDKPVFRAEMLQRWGLPTEGCWHGIRFKSNASSDNEYNSGGGGLSGLAGLMVH